MVMEAQSSAFKFASAGNRRRSNSDLSNVSEDGDDYPIRHHSYVPSVPIMPRAPPSVSTLINLKQRYYFTCPSSSSKGTGGTGLDSGGFTGTEQFMPPDLGTTVLQGIILQMNASKASQGQYGQGDRSSQLVTNQLNGYCDYLRGGRSR